MSKSVSGKAINGALARLCFLFVAVSTAPRMEAKVAKAVFGHMPDGTSVEVYTLSDSAIKTRIMTYGARIVSLEVPDRYGKFADVVLGYDTFEEYIAPPKQYFGAILGRYANRIAHGAFTLDGRQYHLSRNDGENTLHGGTLGFDSRIWKARIVPDGVELTLSSPDGDQGFPGILIARVRYTLRNNSLEIDYTASTNKNTVVNLSNHSHFNLSGEGRGDILGHLLTIYARRYTPVDAQQIPTGQLALVAGTPFDFQKETAIGARIGENNEQLKLAGGYDQNWVIDGPPGQLKRAARVIDPISGRVLTIKTTQPAIQVYTDNHMNGAIHGKHGHIYGKYAALCLETQHFPDSPNHPNFPSTELKAGQTYRTQTIFTFTMQK